jgi:hypothetical protein
LRHRPSFSRTCPTPWQTCKPRSTIHRCSSRRPATSTGSSWVTPPRVHSCRWSAWSWGLAEDSAEDAHYLSVWWQREGPVCCRTTSGETNRISAIGNPTLSTSVVVPGGLPRANPVSTMPKSIQKDKTE